MTDCFKGSFLLLFLIIAQVRSQECPQHCQCPADVPACRAGVSLVKDGCGCCQVCARQRGEQCTKLNPCDSGLQCDHSASLPGEPGECVGLEEVGCELNDVWYSEGQTFRPSCDTLCRCSGGGVSCVRTCPVSSPLPSTDCPNPQYIRLPGTCCPQWVCENLDNTIFKDAITAQQSGRLRPSLPWTPVNRLGPVRPPPARPVCVEQSTQWSACSQSCGPGISTRVSNQNPSCRLQLETRLCKVRPCSPHLPQRTAPGQWSHSGECQPTVLSPGRVRLLHEDCSSTRTFQLRFCGLCSDSRCCTPHHTSTAQVGFICPGGRRQKRAVMLIHSCACHQNCPYAPHKNPALWGFRP
ncbi:unnamed protein product [Knipowitschia caucasica]|uniref:Uncharacterized protein n=1 Tax=Knipowitschia caucasica TaxID=637954 RepID=A0AAV2LZ16_KNICA